MRINSRITHNPTTMPADFLIPKPESTLKPKQSATTCHMEKISKEPRRTAAGDLRSSEGAKAARLVLTSMLPFASTSGILIRLPSAEIAALYETKAKIRRKPTYLAFVVGVVVVALTPVLTTRRLTRMDIPSTLRVVE